MFKLWVVDDFNTFARRDQKVRDAQASYENLYRQREEAHTGDALLYSALASASDELKQVMTIIAKAPAEFLGLLLRESDDISWSRRITRLSGIKDVNANVIAELRTILAGDSSS